MTSHHTLLWAGVLLVSAVPTAQTVTSITAVPDEIAGVHSGRFDHREQARAAVRADLISRGSTTEFGSVIQSLVDALTMTTFDGYLRGVSGDQPIQVEGQSVTIHTRYTGTADGALANDYVYEQAAALGFAVRYQDYNRQGNTYQNVVATLPGLVHPNEVYVLGAHLDCTSEDPFSNAPGAEDNGSGSSALLAALHALAGRGFESTIELVWFTGEEQGLWGSAAYVTQAQNAGVDLMAAVTFDMISYWNDDFGVLIEGGSEWQPLMEVYADAIDAYTAVSREFSYFSFGSDHVSFQDRGVPAILAIDLDWASYPGYHRTTDTYSRLDPALGLEIARAGLATIAHLAVPSTLVDVPGDASPASHLLVVRPNPARDVLTVMLGADVDAHVDIFDVSGRLVRRLGRDVERRVSWDLHDGAGHRVTPGVYWVRTGAAPPQSFVVR